MGVNPDKILLSQYIANHSQYKSIKFFQVLHSPTESKILHIRPISSVNILISVQPSNCKLNFAPTKSKISLEKNFEAFYLKVLCKPAYRDIFLVRPELWQTLLLSEVDIVLR